MQDPPGPPDAAAATTAPPEPPDAASTTTAPRVAVRAPQDTAATTITPRELEAIAAWEPRRVATGDRAAALAARRLRSGGDASANENDYRSGYRSWRRGNAAGATESSAGPVGCHADGDTAPAPAPAARGPKLPAVNLRSIVDADDGPRALSHLREAVAHFGKWENPDVQRAGTLRARRTSQCATSADAAARWVAAPCDAGPFAQDLNGSWRFELFDSPIKALEFVERGGAAGDAIDVPGAWQTLGYDTPVYTNIQYPIAVSTPPSMPRRNTTGVYARTVVPGAAAAAGVLDGSRRCVLHVGAADNAAFVFAGGAWRALWKDARLPGEVDVTEALRDALGRGDDGLEVVCVVVRWTEGSYLEDQDAWKLSGLIRDVYALYPPVSVFDVSWELAGDGAVAVAVDVAAVGRAMAGRLRVALRAAGELPSRRLEPERPYVYVLTVELLDDAQTVLQAEACYVARRDVAIGDDGVLRLNGARLTVAGVNRHETCPAPAFYAACDRCGLLVVDEANVETHGWAPYPGELADCARWREAYFRRVQRMVLRDRSHPCVFCFSLGNEAGYGGAHDDLAAWLRSAEPTRLVHYEPASWAAYEADAAALAPAERGRRDAAGPPAFRDPDMPRLQGGFIWDLADQGLRKRLGAHLSFWAYGGDFGELPTDETFCLNGLLFPDRSPKPSWLEAAAVQRPFGDPEVVGVEARGDSRRLVVRVPSRASRAGAELAALRGRRARRRPAGDAFGLRVVSATAAEIRVESRCGTVGVTIDADTALPVGYDVNGEPALLSETPAASGGPARRASSFRSGSKAPVTAAAVDRRSALALAALDGGGARAPLHADELPVLEAEVGYGELGLTGRVAINDDQREDSIGGVVGRQSPLVFEVRDAEKKVLWSNAATPLAEPGASQALDADLRGCGATLELRVHSPWGPVDVAHAVWVDPLLWWAPPDDTGAPPPSPGRDRLAAAAKRYARGPVKLCCERAFTDNDRGGYAAAWRAAGLDRPLELARAAPPAGLGAVGDGGGAARLRRLDDGSLEFVARLEFGPRAKTLALYARLDAWHGSAKPGDREVLAPLDARATAAAHLWAAARRLAHADVPRGVEVWVPRVAPCSTHPLGSAISAAQEKAMDDDEEDDGARAAPSPRPPGDALLATRGVDARPHECYPDRKAAALFGAFGGTVDDLFVPYLRPSECGNRTGVERLALASPSLALGIAADFGAFDFSAARHGDRDLATAARSTSTSTARSRASAATTRGRPASTSPSSCRRRRRRPRLHARSAVPRDADDARPLLDAVDGTSKKRVGMVRRSSSGSLDDAGLAPSF
ncbi:glycosyl hydrolase [Aureococcus anophagefferens]|nr:glycosyl hydrolase [Aureococcus anophagefferens]